MKGFEFITAKDARHAIALLVEHGPKAKILAGGTDLLVDLKSVPEAPPAVIDITRAADLQGIRITDRGLVIGALVTHSEIMSSPEIRERFPALVDAAHTIGAVQTRSLGTLGGNLVTAVPSLDSGPALVALEAFVLIEGPGGTREMPLDMFFVGPRRTALKADELLTSVVIPRKNLGKPAGFQKFGLRKGQALALVNTGAAFWVDPDRKTFVDPCIALGAVAPTVIRAPKAEAFLAGKKVTAEAMEEAGRIAAEEAKPISDFRASADYRRHLIAVLTKRSLAGALAVADRTQKRSVK